MIHRTDLRDSHVTLVYKRQKFPLREIIEQCERRLSGFSPVEITAVIFYAAAIAYLTYHFEVVFRALFKPLSFEQFTLVSERFNLAFEVLFYNGKRAVEFFRADRILACRKNHGVFQRAYDFSP